MRRRRLLPLALIVAALAGCQDGHGQGRAAPPLAPPAPGVGPDARWRPPSLSRAVAAAAPVGALRCSRSEHRRRFGVHLELFASRRVVLVPPGIGIAPPRAHSGAYVTGGRCSYPVRTREPTGVLEMEPSRRLRLGDAFAIWGRPLGPNRLAGFRGRVTAFVAGRRRRGDPRTIPLTPHAQIVLELGGHVAPHASYRFGAGL